MTKRRQQRRPAMTPEARENQMISAAMDLAERRILEGTASAQEVVHFLKLGSTREMVEQERLRNENELSKQKVLNMRSAERIETLYAEALNAMRGYSGQPPVELEYDEYGDYDEYEE